MTEHNKNNTERRIRIGGGAGFWGDTQEAPRQLVMHGDIDYLVFDYLAEVTMSILVRAKQKSPDAGYARDFVDLVMKPLLHDIKARNIRVVVNAGGVNVAACAAALAKVADEAGVSLNIGTVEGDNLVEQIDDLGKGGITEMFTGAPLPDKLISANAYLGAFPIAAALDAGAEVVITGRCVDSAVTLGPLIHEFGWTEDDYDKLACGTLAGHILECGAQATGGNFTDWRDVAEGWDDMGYPIAECRADGRFAICKPDNTGGLVSRLTVGEQILYEIGDPGAYVMPDVVCDFSRVSLTESGTDRVEVSNVKGLPPTDSYKVSSTWADGYRATASTVITGFDAVEKGQAFAQALLRRTKRLFSERGLGDYRDTAIHLIGAETLWGNQASDLATQTRELTVRIDVRHNSREALELFSKETSGAALAMTTGRCSAGAAGRPKVTPVIAQFAFLVGKTLVPPTVTVNGRNVELPAAHIPKRTEPVAIADAGTMGVGDDAPASDLVAVPLIELAVARSGDKGDSANIGVLARNNEVVPWILRSVTAERVGQWFAHTLEGEVTRYELPGFQALNFVLTRCLGGGGTSSLHLDNLAKTYAQQLLAMPVPVPTDLAARLNNKKHSCGE